MTRKRVALFCASALVLLYSYEVVVDVGNGAEMKWLTLIGLSLALALLVVELRTHEKDSQEKN